METFSALLALCAGNSPVTGPVTRSFDVFFDLRLYKRLSKQWWGWWFETPSRPLWRIYIIQYVMIYQGHIFLMVSSYAVPKKYDKHKTNIMVSKLTLKSQWLVNTSHNYCTPMLKLGDMPRGTCRYTDVLVQNCSHSSASAMELLQSCTKPFECFTRSHEHSSRRAFHWQRLTMVI